MYRVVKEFYDLKDSVQTKGGSVYHCYRVGDEYPRKGAKTNNERIKELSGKENIQGTPLIELVEASKAKASE